MDDIKLYARSKQDIDSLIHPTKIYTSDSGMLFELEREQTKRVMVVRTEGIAKPKGNIADTKNSENYRAISQGCGNHEAAARKVATTKYLQRLRQVQKS